MKHRVNHLSAESAAYIAGILDGEGTITLTRLHADENRRLVVSIANTEMQLLNFVLGEIGAGKITRKKTTSDRHSPSFCYAVTSRQALDLLRQIVRYLRSYKRQRAEFALQHYRTVTPRNGKYTPLQLTERKLFEDKLLSMVPQRADSLSR